MNRSLTILSMVGVLDSTPLARAQWPHLAGKPLRQPIVNYGPFVMNTSEQIEQALADYRSGNFGRI